MTRTKLLVSIAAGGLVAGAFLAPSAASALGGPSATAATTASSSDDDGGKNCPYPSNKTPQLTLLATPSTISKGGKSTMSGKVMNNKCGMKGMKVGLYSSPKSSGPFTSTGATTMSDSTGSYTFAPVSPAATTYYATATPQTSTWDAAISNVVSVIVK